MSFLHSSTHFRNWLFTEEQLQKCAELRHSKAKASYRERVKKSEIESSSIPPAKPRSFACLLPTRTCVTPNKNDRFDTTEMEEEQDDTSDPTVYLTMEEEDTIRSFYEKKVHESCIQLFRTSDKVRSSAIMLYKRFYQSNSVMEFHPKYIVPTVIYVAGKVEEQYISVETISKQLNLENKDIIAHEMIVLEGTRFQLIMYHPFRSLVGYIEDARTLSKVAGKEQLDRLVKLHANTTTIINEMLLTNLPLIYTPSALALAAFRRAARKEKAGCPIDVDEYISKTQHANGKVNEVVAILDEMDKKIDVALSSKPDESNVKKIYKKLKSFHKSPPSSTSTTTTETSSAVNGDASEPPRKKHKKEKKKKEKKNKKKKD